MISKNWSRQRLGILVLGLLVGGCSSMTRSSTAAFEAPEAPVAKVRFPASTNYTCSLTGYGSCSPSSNLSGSVLITANSGYDIEIDGTYVGTGSYTWNTASSSAGAHYLQECAYQDDGGQSCSQVYVPNNVYVPDLVWVSNLVYVPDYVYVDDYECTDYDDDGNCTNYEDDGYYEDDGSYVDEGYYEDEGGYVDEGGYQTVCTDNTSQTYVCSGRTNVTVTTPTTPVTPVPPTQPAPPVTPTQPVTQSSGSASLIFQNIASALPWSWTMNGVSHQGPDGPLGDAEPGWRFVGTMPIPGSQDHYMLWQNIASGLPWYWTMRGKVHVGPDGPLGPAVPGWTFVGAMPIPNGGGNSYLLFQNNASGLPWYWTMKGTTHLGIDGPMNPAVPGWKFVGAMPIPNGGGNSYLLFQNIASGLPWYWKMNGNVPTGVAGPLGPAVPGWDFVGAMRNPNGSGNSYLLFQNQASGLPWYWTMDGVNHIGIDGPMNPAVSGWKFLGGGF